MYMYLYQVGVTCPAAVNAVVWMETKNVAKSMAGLIGVVQAEQFQKNVETKIGLLCAGAVSAVSHAQEAQKIEQLCAGAVSAEFHAQELCVAVVNAVPGVAT